jgi:hypothetical protein
LLFLPRLILRGGGGLVEKEPRQQRSAQRAAFALAKTVRSVGVPLTAALRIVLQTCG